MKTEVLDRKVRTRTVNSTGSGFLMDKTVKRMPLRNTRKAKKAENGFFGFLMF
ncbi:hypothetical protein BH23BAC2_BH23BAC2_07390 [soil metagenome]